MVHKRPDLHYLFQSTWRSRQCLTDSISGPLALVIDTIHFLGWTWPAVFTFVDHEGVELDLMSLDSPVWEHRVREALGMQVWKTAAQRRSDMQGIQDGINREATQALTNSTKPNSGEKGMLRSIMAGGLWTEDRKCRARLSQSPMCRYCDTKEVEDHNHICWQYPAWRNIRHQYRHLVDMDRHERPPCLMS